MKVKDCMCHDVKFVTPNTSVCDCAKLMSDNNIGCVPVCDENNKVVGLITDRDVILRTVACNKDSASTKVSDIMTCNVCTCNADANIEEAEKRGIANKETVMKKSKWFMIPFCVIIFVALILIISIWNHVTDFKTAYFQSFLFLVIMNWFDGIVIDRLWVGHSKIWHIEGMEDVSYVKSWKTVLIKRGAATVVYMLVALVVAGIVVLISKI